MNPEERASRLKKPGNKAAGMARGSSAREAGGRTTTEETADVEAAREALAEIEAGAATVPADQVWAELIPDLASGTNGEPGVV